jgi:hypothetical protein
VYIVFKGFDSKTPSTEVIPTISKITNEPGQCAAKVTQDRCLLIDASQARKLHPE